MKGVGGGPRTLDWTFLSSRTGSGHLQEGFLAGSLNGWSTLIRVFLGASAQTCILPIFILNRPGINIFTYQFIPLHPEF